MMKEENAIISDETSTEIDEDRMDGHKSLTVNDLLGDLLPRGTGNGKKQDEEMQRRNKK